MIHTNYQPTRKGLIQSRIDHEKEQAIQATIRCPEAKAELMRGLYGTKSLQAEAIAARDPVAVAEFQRQHLRYSDRGDFTRCYRGGF